jgi:hypothetical protein
MWEEKGQNRNDDFGSLAARKGIGGEKEDRDQPGKKGNPVFEYE